MGSMSLVRSWRLNLCGWIEVCVFFLMCGRGVLRNCDDCSLLRIFMPSVHAPSLLFNLLNRQIVQPEECIRNPG